MPGRYTPVSSLSPLVDRIVEQRYLGAVDSVAELRSRHPDASASQLADLLIRRATRELAAVAAVSGGTAAIPGVGTAAAVASASADMAWTLTRLGELAMAIGIAHGHDAGSFEERKAWVLAVLAMANGAMSGVEGAAAKIGQRGGIAVVERLTGRELTGVNSVLGTKIAARLASEQVAVRLGRLVPFGIGAGIGAAGNALITRSIGRAAKEFFGSSPEAGRRASRGEAVIDVSAVERSAGGEPAP